MMCQRIGLSPMGIIGLGTRSVVSPMRRPRPPQKSTTFTEGLAVAGSPLDDLGPRDRDNELRSPLLDMRELPRDLLPQVPRQYEDVVRPRLVDHARRMDR